MKRITTVRMVLTIFLGTGFAVLPEVVSAQEVPSRTVHGTVTDRGGAPVAAATVSFTSEDDTAGNFTTVTAADGSYAVEISTFAASAVEEFNDLAPTGFELLQNYPNPFNPTTIIPYTLPVSGFAELSIYNVLGHRVRRLVSGYESAGWRQTEWNGRDDAGRPVAAGVYVYRLRVGKFVATGKMAMIDGPTGGGIPHTAFPAGRAARALAQEPVETFVVTISGGDIVTYVESGIVIPASNRLDFVVERIDLSDEEMITAAVENLQEALNDRDLQAYAALLGDRFSFTETDCSGQLLFANGLLEELVIMGGESDRSRAGLFEIFTTFEFAVEILEHRTELAEDFPAAFDGDPDGHPEADWLVVVARVKLLLVDENQDGFRIDQIMRLKFSLEGDSQADDGPEEWKLVRWIDDPLLSCTDSKPVGTPKSAAEEITWGWIKFVFVPGEPPAEPPDEPQAGEVDATFPGQFIAGVIMESSVVDGVGPNQDLVFRLFGQGMAGVKQLEFKLDIEPPEFFDIAQSSFVPESPFFTISNGILISEPGLICLGAASLGDAVEGDSVLGMLTLHTSGDASVNQGATIQFRSLSIGPNANDRDKFPRGELGMCVTVNGGSETGCR
jgi:hypothetical protein